MVVRTIEDRFAKMNFYPNKHLNHITVENRWKLLHEYLRQTITSFQNDERKLIADIHLLFESCKIYNDDSSNIHKTAVKFTDYVDEKLH